MTTELATTATTRRAHTRFGNIRPRGRDHLKYGILALRALLRQRKASMRRSEAERAGPGIDAEMARRESRPVWDAPDHWRR